MSYTLCATGFFLIFIQSTYTMNEKDQISPDKKPSISTSRQLLYSPCYIHHVPTHSNNNDLPTITITSSSSLEILENSSNSSSKASSKNSKQSKTITHSSKKHTKHHNVPTITIPTPQTKIDISPLTSPTSSPTISPKSSPKKSSLKSSLPSLPIIFNSSSHGIKHHSSNELKELPRSKSVDSYESKKIHKDDIAKKFSKSDSAVDSSISSHQIKTSHRSSRSDENNIISLVRYKDFNTIQNFLENSDYNPNVQNEFGMTALHYATLNAIQSKQTDILTLLFFDPRTNSCIKNNDSLKAFDFIKGSDALSEIRTILFARLTLDKTVTREMFIMLIDLHIKKKLINDKCIEETVENIKNRILTTQSLQGDTILPETAQLPTYATDKFITKMIIHRMPQNATTTENLIVAIHKEISALLFNVEIDNIMICNATNTVKETFLEISSQKSSQKKSKRLCLPSYADYEFIFDVIKHYIQKEKINIKPSFSEMISQNSIIQIFADSKK